MPFQPFCDQAETNRHGCEAQQMLLHEHNTVSANQQMPDVCTHVLN